MTEQLIQFKTWRIWADVDQNREIYSQILTGSPEQCDCINCREFIGIRDSFYTTTLVVFVTSLGIDHRKEAEIVWYGDDGKPPKRLEGWYNLVGRVESGEQDLQSIDEGFQLEISSQGLLVQNEFEGYSVMRLEWAWSATDARNQLETEF